MIASSISVVPQINPGERAEPYDFADFLDTPKNMRQTKSLYGQGRSFDGH
jgi:hypothetical protein